MNEDSSMVWPAIRTVHHLINTSIKEAINSKHQHKMKLASVLDDTNYIQ